MSGNLRVSIVLCTCNRAAALAQALDHLGELRVRPEWKTELLVVDNGSTDETATVTKAAKLANMEVRYLHEPRKGKSNALNTALALASGDIILFTDDDVVPAENWAEAIISHLSRTGCDAVTGLTVLAENLRRPWLTPAHKWWLASSDDAELHHGARELIGANMGFRREVLERVRAFDPELGPGALGLAEDTLFGWQLIAAGLKIEYAPQARAVHHLNSSRLLRSGWLDESRKHGRSEGYLRYHWEHSDIRNPRLSQLYYAIKLFLRRMLQPPPALASEGCPPWEMSYVLHEAKCRQFLLESRRPRNYEPKGLTKLSFAEGSKHRTGSAARAESVAPAAR